MALETRPFPVLTGQAAKDFRQKVENFRISQTKEEVQEINRKVHESIAKSRELGYV